jgi:hypothetical protein
VKFSGLFFAGIILAALPVFAETAARSDSIVWREVPLTEEMMVGVWDKKIPKNMNIAWAADLNKDGVDELLFQPNPRHPKASSYSNNVFVRIYSQNQDGIFHRLLSDEMPATVMPKILPSSTNGYHDIRITRHISAHKNSQTFYKFDGKKYVSQECWIIMFDSEKKEKITPQKCYKR